MSILIKGLNIPYDCLECYVAQFCKEYQDEENKRPYGCPIVELPEPHGRLIEADKVTKKMEKITTEAWQKKLSDTVEHTLNMSIDIIKGAPTVIEAEGKIDSK